MTARLALLACDESADCRRLLHLLAEECWGADRAESREHALDLLRRRDPALVIVSPRCGAEAEGIETAHDVRREAADVAVWFCPAQSSESLAIRALRAGVSDYLGPPLAIPEVRERLRGLTRASEGLVSRVTPRRAPPAGDRMIGSGPRLGELRRLVGRFAASSCPVLVTGETGTGKELVAEMIHRASARAREPFIRINCAAIPDALFESEMFGHERGAFTGALARRDGAMLAAQRGTLFLDEIAELSPLAQAKLLRVVECREVRRLGGEPVPIDVRIVAATNRRVDAWGTEAGFRSDLYFRLSVARIDMPPLRERREDIVHLVARIVEEFNERLGTAVRGFDAEAMALLLTYAWPGNVRELRNVIESAMLQRHGDVLGAGDLPPGIGARPADGAPSAEGEAGRMLAALLETNWNKTRAAKLLNWSRMTLYRKIAKLGIGPEVPESPRSPRVR